MATDDITRSMSFSLYHHLCKNIVGYEDHVKTMRMMNNVKDNLLRNDTYTIVTSGSYGEGLEMEGSDIDMMHVLKTIEVLENISFVVLAKHKTYFSMKGEDTKPGFTYLSLEFNNAIDILPTCLNVRGLLYLSNALFKRKFAHDSMPVEHGPCLSNKNGDFDIAYCLYSKAWISQAKQWISRPNKSWPTAKVKQNIIDHGVLFVPIGEKGSRNEEIEWRLSFSVGEKLLIYSFSHTQLLCYALLKILLKDVINTDIQCKDLLCSYFLKTVIFWVSEEIQPSVWSPENLMSCFMRCFRRLIYYVKYSVCPNYFIPDNNMFANKIEGQERQLILNNLNALHKYDWSCIFLSPQISQFEVLLTQIISINAFTCSINKIVHSKGFLLSSEHSFEKHKRRSYARAVYECLRFRTNRIRRIHLYYTSFLCRSIGDTILLTPIHGNKYKYDQYKTCLSYLLQNINHDPATGWLMLALFFFKVQQYEIALNIILYALSKCTMEKLFYGRYLADIHFELLSTKSIRKMGITNILKMLNLRLCCFETQSTLIPAELQKEVNTTPYMIAPVVCAQFVSLLVHYHLKNTKQCRKCIRDLQLTIADEYLIPNNDFVKSVSYNCLGVALQLLGETKCAKQAFHESSKLDPRY